MSPPTLAGAAVLGASVPPGAEVAVLAPEAVVPGAAVVPAEVVLVTPFDELLDEHAATEPASTTVTASVAPQRVRTLCTYHTRSGTGSEAIAPPPG